jgi:hypothetical protein
MVRRACLCQKLGMCVSIFRILQILKLLCPYNLNIKNIDTQLLSVSSCLILTKKKMFRSPASSSATLPQSLLEFSAVLSLCLTPGVLYLYWSGFPSDAYS